jgi:probable phosphoglycerate mutase
VRLYVIRHGETELNARRVVQPADTPLSKRGLEQARRVADRLVPERIDHIVASDMPRARMTAEAVQRSTGASLELEPLLQERNFGDVRGTPYSELDVDLFGPDFHPPNGESWGQFDERVRLAFERIDAIASRVSGRVAVVTHGLVCRGFVARHMVHPDDPDTRGPLHWANTSVTIAEGPAPWRIRVLNCTAHLEEESPGSAPA